MKQSMKGSRNKPVNMAKSDWEPANGKPLVKIIDVRKEV
jgi:hypothetical protein